MTDVESALKQCTWLAGDDDDDGERRAIAARLQRLLTPIDGAKLRVDAVDACCGVVQGHLLEAEPLFIDGLCEQLSSDAWMAREVLTRTGALMRQHLARVLAPRFFAAFEPHSATDGRWRCAATLDAAIEDVLPCVSRYHALLDNVLAPALHTATATTIKSNNNNNKNKNNKNKNNGDKEEDAKACVARELARWNDALRAALGAGASHRRGFGLAFGTVMRAEFAEFERWRRDNETDDDLDDDVDEEEEEEEEEEDEDDDDDDGVRRRWLDRRAADGGASAFGALCTRLHALRLATSSEDLLSAVLFDATQRRVARVDTPSHRLLAPLRRW
jgi:hypothetical protein